MSSLSLLVVASVAAVATPASAASISPLALRYGTAVSGDGSVAASYRSGSGTVLEGPGGVVAVPGMSGAEGLDQTGETLVGFRSGPGAGELSAVRWTAAGGEQVLDSLGGDRRFALGVSADGNVVVGRAENPDGLTRPVRWNAAGEITELQGLPNSTRSGVANAASADGYVVVGYHGDEGGYERAVVWQGTSAPLLLPDLPNAPPRDDPLDPDKPGSQSYSNVWDVSDDGLWLTGSAASGPTSIAGFRWNAATGIIEELPWLPGREGYAYAKAISNDGRTIGGGMSGSLPSDAFVWHEDVGTYSLRQILSRGGVDVSGWDLLSRINAISADGLTVVGEGRFEGLSAGFVATLPANWTTLVPEPGTGLLMGLGLAFLVMRGGKGPGRP